MAISDSAVGDTFQAVRGHRFDNPLAAPGLADLSAHVDFEALAISRGQFRNEWSTGRSIKGRFWWRSELTARGQSEK